MFFLATILYGHFMDSRKMGHFEDFILEAILTILGFVKIQTMKYSFLVFTIIVFDCFNLQGQNQDKIDSLLHIYNKKLKNIEHINTLAALYNEYLYRQPEKAKDFALEEIMVSQEIGYESGLAHGYYHLAAYYSNMDLIDSSEIYYTRAKDIYNSLNDLDGITSVNHGMGILEYSNGNYSNAIDLLNKNVKIYKTKFKDSSGLAITYDLIGSINMYMGNYNIALHETLKSLTILDKIDDEIRKADALNHLAAIEFHLQNFEKSLEYNETALSIYRKNQDRYYEAQALNDIGNTYYYLNQYDKALQMLNESLKISEDMSIMILEATALNNLGKTYERLKDYRRSESYLKKSLSILENTDNRNKIVEVLNDLAQVYNSQNTPMVSLQVLNRSIGLAKEIGVKENLRTAYQRRSEAYEKLGEIDKAFLDYKNFKLMTDSIFNTTKSNQIEEMRTIYETEKKEVEIALQQEEIKTLNAQKIADRLQKGLYAGGMASALAVSGLLFFGFRQRIKKNRIAREKQEAIYQKEIEHKQKELASQTLHLVQKNTFIQELMENLENIKNSPEKFKMEFRRIVMLLKKENASDKDWEVFKSYFADVHNDFDQKLKTIYPDISEKEIRLAAFLRMNLTTKEIAATLNVLPDSILKSKYRLKKKLGLDKDTDLNQFLNTL